MKTIGIDCRFADTHTGLGRYTRSLVSALVSLESPDLQFHLFVRSPGEPWLRALADRAEMTVADIPHFSLKEQTSFPVVLHRSGIYMLFAPHFNVPLLCPVPFVATIHDLILHRFPGDASLFKRAAYRLQMRSTVTAARSLIAISAFTAKEIADTYGERAHAKTSVVIEGVDEQFVPASAQEIEHVRNRYDLRKPFFLYVGNAREHKNTPMLLKAFSSSGSAKELILIMSKSDAAKLSLPASVRVLHDVSDEDLPVLYSAADCFVTATLYEGFCLPVAEALACGCPVIAFDLTATPEAAAGKARLIPPTQEALTAALQSPPARAGKAPAPRLWHAVAAETLGVLRSAL